MDFLILGSLEVRSAGQSLPLHAAKQRAVLAILVLHANQPVRVDLIAEGVWGEDPPASARNLIKTYVWRLRQILDAAEPAERSRISTLPDSYRLSLLPAELDMAKFGLLVDGGHSALKRGDVGAAASLLRAALELWRADALCDTQLEGRPAQAQLALAQRRVSVLDEAICLEMLLGRSAELVPELKTLVAADPLQERWHAQLIRALYYSGRRTEAFRAYDAARRIIAAELGVEPCAELQRLHDGLAADTGDLESPLRQGWRSSAGTRSLRFSPSACLHQLPARLAMFAGRTAEMHTILATAQQRRRPVVAISGPPGVGKTALAVEAAHRMKEQFPDGQLFAELDGDADPVTGTRHALRSLLLALGVSAGQQPAGVADALAMYRSLTAGRRMLVVLDDARDEQQARSLLPADEGSLILVTSQVALAGIEEARHVRLDVLGVDDATALLLWAADRQATEVPADGVADAVQICGALPMALRIAGLRLASRPQWSLSDLLGLLGPETRRLSELVAGDLSVRACFDRAYRRLHPDLQYVFRRLSLYGQAVLTVEDAARLVEAGVTETEQGLERLADASLIDPEGRGTFRLHSLLRIYAAECRIADDACGHLVERAAAAAG
jgi:DNA-binding SARP family transcriptional activator